MNHYQTKVLILMSILISAAAWAGPFVSEGPGSIGDILECSGQRSSFVIRHTAAVTIEQGLYQANRRSPKNAVSMECALTQNMWNCQELNEVGGENLLYARAYENSQGIITAQIFQKNIAGQEVFIDSLLCKKSE